MHVEHLQLGVRLGVAHRHARGEAVALGLGEGIGALHLDGVLGGDHHEGRVQLVRPPVDRHLVLLHALQQRGLRLGGGSVDLVAHHDVGEHRAGLELELPGLLVVGADPGDVTGQQVGGELDPPDGAVDGACERLGQHRLADPWHVLDQQVAFGEQDRQRETDGVALALDHRFDRLPNPVGGGDQLVELGRDVMGYCHQASMRSATAVPCGAIAGAMPFLFHCLYDPTTLWVLQRHLWIFREPRRCSRSCRIEVRIP